MDEYSLYLSTDEYNHRYHRYENMFRTNHVGRKCEYISPLLSSFTLYMSPSIHPQFTSTHPNVLFLYFSIFHPHPLPLPLPFPCYISHPKPVQAVWVENIVHLGDFGSSSRSRSRSCSRSRLVPFRSSFTPKLQPSVCLELWYI